MKKIEAIVRPYKVEAVKEALKALGITGMSISKVEGIGTQQGHRELYRGMEIHVDSNPKSKIEVAVDDDQVAMARDSIVRLAKTGAEGDGKVFIYNIEEAVAIRSGKAFEKVSELPREPRRSAPMAAVWKAQA